jgi:hypothetical protein
VVETMNLYKRAFYVLELENKLENEKQMLIDEYADFFTKVSNNKFECTDTDEGKYAFFESFIGNYSDCTIKVDIYGVRLVYVSTENEQLKEVIEKSFKNMLDNE